MCGGSGNVQAFRLSKSLKASKIVKPTAECVSSSNLNLNHDETSNLSNIYDTFDLIDPPTNRYELNLNMLNAGMDEFDFSAEPTLHEAMVAEGQNYIALTPISTNMLNEPLHAKAEEDDFDHFVSEALTTGFGNDADSESSSRAVDGGCTREHSGKMSDMMGMVVHTSKARSKHSLSKEDEAAATLAASACLSNLADDIAAAAEICIDDYESHVSIGDGFGLPPFGSHIDHNKEEALCLSNSSKHLSHVPDLLEGNEDEKEIFKEQLNQDDIVQAIVAAAVDAFDDVKTPDVCMSPKKMKDKALEVAMQAQVKFEAQRSHSPSDTKRKPDSDNEKNFCLYPNGNAMKIKKARLLTAVDLDRGSQQLDMQMKEPLSYDWKNTSSMFFNNGETCNLENLVRDKNIRHGENADMHVGDNNNISITEQKGLDINPSICHLKTAPLGIAKNAEPKAKCVQDIKSSGKQVSKVASKSVTKPAPHSKSQSDLKWDEMFNSLCTFIEEKRQQFVKENPHAEWVWDGNVPTTYKTACGKALGRWINNQRSAKQKGVLKPERDRRLVSTGLKWSVLSTYSWP